MLTWIVTHSEPLCKFLRPLLDGFTPAQERHTLNFIEALLVCAAKHKTLAALTRLLQVPHADEYALADFFRVSPWPAATLRQALTRWVLATVVTIQAKTGWHLLFLGVDDALCRKDVATQALEAVGLHYDHSVQRRQKGQCTNASRYVSVHLELGPVQFALAWRLYLKRSQVKALNRQRRAHGQPVLAYHGLTELVLEMLREIAPHLPTTCGVYVLFDAWYDNHQLQRFIHAQGWHWICAARSNRRLGRYPLAQWWTHLGHQRIIRVSMRSATRSHSYSTRQTVGRLRRFPVPVKAILSKRARRDKTPAYFLCSDTSLSARCILKYYGYRWSTEVDNWFLKERFGLADYRLHSVEAITAWHTLVFAAYVFIQAQRIRPLLTNPKASLCPPGDVLAEHQRWHVRHTVLHIAHLVRAGYSDARLLRELALT